MPGVKVNSMDKFRQEEEERWQATNDIARAIVRELTIVRFVLVTILVLRAYETFFKAP